MANLQATDAGNKKYKTYKRYKVRLLIEGWADCHILAPSREAAVRCAKNPELKEEHFLVTKGEWERPRVYECVYDLDYVNVVADEEGNIIEEGCGNVANAAYVTDEPPRHLIGDYSKKVRWKNVPREYPRILMREERPTLNPQAIAAFKRAGFETIEELAAHTQKELLKKRNVGRKTIKELKAILEELGYKLGGER